MNKRSASALVYVIFFFVVFLAFCAFAVDAALVFTDRAKLQNATEAVALAAASEFKYKTNAPAGEVKDWVFDIATDTFNVIKMDGLKHATINIQVAYDKKEVLVETQNISQPVFLSVLGVSGIKLEAKSCAISERLYVTSNYTNVSWLTAGAAYFSDIISKDLNLNDTAILLPLGDFMSASYDTVTDLVDFGLIDSADGHPVSLGPGGFITIKLPAPIIDKNGNDLFIKELGAQEGYFVYAGLDANPENPYVNAGNVGEGIQWVNISCTGTPVQKDIKNGLGAYSASTTNLGVKTKFYGSGYFDIGASCSDGFQGISMAKYIRIIDDNSETAFVTNSLGVKNSEEYHKAMLYGESSTATSGADIDAVAVLNHVKLIQPSTFEPDS